MPRRQRCPGLDGQKMSKSYGNTIDIFGEEKEMRKRVMSIVTDSTPGGGAEGSRRVDDFPALLLFATTEEAAAMGEAFRARRHRLRRFQEAVIRETLGVFRADAETAE